MNSQTTKRIFLSFCKLNDLRGSVTDTPFVVVSFFWAEKWVPGLASGHRGEEASKTKGSKSTSLFLNHSVKKYPWKE